MNIILVVFRKSENYDVFFSKKEKKIEIFTSYRKKEKNRWFSVYA